MKTINIYIFFKDFFPVDKTANKISQPAVPGQQRSPAAPSDYTATPSHAERHQEKQQSEDATPRFIKETGDTNNPR